MKLFLVVLIAVAFANSQSIQAQLKAADNCVDDKCNIADNCRCSSTEGPLALSDTPQLIVLAFVDAAKQDIYDNIWTPLVQSRQNPDEDFISATFYIPHEYSDYSIVHDLAATGFEIAVHSITNEAHKSYWQSATQDLLEKEFGGQRTIISKFANIPKEYITGTLTPQLELAGDNSISAFVAQGFTYDNTWATRNGLYPYTLDYASIQDCGAGEKCPTEPHPGFWIAPIVDLISEDGDVCATLAGCFRSRNNQTAEEITDWVLEQVNNVKKVNRAPLTFIIEENLFRSVNESWAGLMGALDKLEEDKEVFLVSQSRVIEWMKDPVPLSEFKTGYVTVDEGCSQTQCTLKNDNDEIRYMNSCVPCPKSYPWLDNPEGN